MFTRYGDDKMFNKIAEKALEKMHTDLCQKVEKGYPEGEEKEKVKNILKDFLPAFKKALKEGDVTKLMKLREACDDIKRKT